MDAKRILFLDYDGVICDFWDRYHGLHADLCAGRDIMLRFRDQSMPFQADQDPVRC